MLDYTISKVTKADEPFLWEMLYLSIFTPPGHEPLSKDILKEPSISKYVSNWGRSGDTGFIARLESGKPIGSVMARLFSEDNKSYGYIDAETPEIGMALLPEYRGMAIGTELLKAILDELRNQGFKMVSLSVDPDNPAIRLYRRFYFKEVGMVDTSVTMKLIL